MHYAVRYAVFACVYAILTRFHAVFLFAYYISFVLWIVS